jgi:predicted amidohydrolase
VAVAQIGVPLLDREACVDKVVSAIRDAGSKGVELVAFGEACIPGYPVWLGPTGGAEFDSPTQKAIHAKYLREAVCIEDGHLDRVVKAASEAGCFVVLGIIERPRYVPAVDGDTASASVPASSGAGSGGAGGSGSRSSRSGVGASGTTVYCSLVHISPRDGGRLLTVHRKLVPTYEERLAWAHGDAEGLVCHEVGPFTMGATCCFETWMPLPRAALQAQGENLHIAIWPGSRRNTRDITRFAAIEARSFVISASCVLRLGDIPETIISNPGAPAGSAGTATGAASLPVMEAVAKPTVDATVPLRALCAAGYRGLAPSQMQASGPTDGIPAERLSAAAKAVAESARTGALARVPPGTVLAADDAAQAIMHDGGSCIAGPDGSWIISPDDTCDGQERLIIADIDIDSVRGERQNFDPAGHYSRPELLRLVVEADSRATPAVRQAKH